MSSQKKKDQKDLPEFIIDTKSQIIDDSITNNWLANNLHQMMIWVSVIWFGVVLIYITQFFGWDNLFLMMPDEFGGFLAGVTLPLAIIWVVMAYIDRGTSFKNEAKFLRAYMNQLVYPEEGGAQTAKAMADAIRSQVVELQEVTKLAITQTDKIKQELGGRVDDFAQLVATLDKYSTKTIVELSDSIKSLSQNFDQITNKAEDSTQIFKSYSSDFSHTSEQMSRDVAGLIDSLTLKIEEMKRSANLLDTISNENSIKIGKTSDLIIDLSSKATDTINEVANNLEGQTDRLEKASKMVTTSFGGINKNLEDSLGKIDDTLKTQSKFVLEHVNILDKKSDLLSKKFAEHREEISVEADKVVARANVIDERIAMQVRELNGVAESIVESIKQVEENIENQVSNLKDQSDSAIHEISNVSATIEDQVGHLTSISSQASGSLEVLTKDVEERNNDLERIYSEITNNLHSLSGEITENADYLEKQVKNSMAHMGEVTSSMQKSSDTLLEASSIVVSQSKIGEQALAQQQRHITGSMNKIEEIKSEIKRQLDELYKVSEAIDDDATSAINRLKTQMESVLKSSENVVSRAKALNDSIEEQAANFDTSTNKTLSRVSNFEHNLNVQYKKLDSLSDLINDRSTTVAKTLDKHANLVNKATQNSENKLTNILTTFETQSSVIGEVTDLTINKVDALLRAIDEKAENIVSLFNSQEASFMDICDKISLNTTDISANLKKQVTTIEQSADKAFSKMANLEEDITKRSEEVVVNSGKTIDKLHEISNVINVQNQEVTEAITTISMKLLAASDNFKEHISGFSGFVKEIQGHTNESTATIASHYAKVKDINTELIRETKNATDAMDGQVKVLDTAVSKTQSQTKQIVENLEAQRETITDIVNTLSTQTRLGEASLAQQYKYLSDATTEVAERMNEINNQFKGNTDNIFDTTGKLSYEFDILGDKLIKISEDIFTSSRNSIKNVDQVNIALSNSAEDLVSTTNNSTGKVREVIKEYENYINNFHTVTAEASSGVIEINELISQQSNKMLSISEGTKELVEIFNTLLADTSVQLSDKATAAYDTVKGLGENLKTLSLQLEDSTKMSAKHLENSSDKIRATITEISGNAERIANDIRTSGEVFLKQSGVLVAATDDTLQKVNNVMEVLTKSTDDFSKKSESIIKSSSDFNNVFEKQLDVLDTTSAKALKQIKDLEKQYAGTKADSFLKDAAKIIEKLETVAVDINRIFNPKSEDEIWKKYYAGDTAAFVRHLAKTMTKQQVVAIRKEFEGNLDFRNLVNNYLSEFEALVNKARTNERSSILLSVISGADIGKVYYILAKALDKLH